MVISSIMKDLKDEGEVVLTISQLNSPLWHVQNFDGYWIIIVRSSTLIQEVTPIAVTMPGLVSLLQQVNIFPGTSHAAIDLADAFFSTLIHRAHQDQFS